VGELLTRLLAFLRPFLHHPYNNVRSRLGAVLTNIFALDIEFPGQGGASATSPSEAAFLASMLEQLAPLEAEGAGEEEQEEARRLLQTLSKWAAIHYTLHYTLHPGGRPPPWPPTSAPPGRTCSSCCRPCSGTSGTTRTLSSPGTARQHSPASPGQPGADGGRLIADG
jgi:hypothetical protein